MDDLLRKFSGFIESFIENVTIFAASLSAYDSNAFRSMADPNFIIIHSWSSGHNSVLDRDSRSTIKQLYRHSGLDRDFWNRLGRVVRSLTKISLGSRLARNFPTVSRHLGRDFYSIFAEWTRNPTPRD